MIVLNSYDARKPLTELKIVAKFITKYLAKKDFNTSPFRQAFLKGKIDIMKLFIDSPLMDFREVDDQGLVKDFAWAYVKKHELHLDQDTIYFSTSNPVGKVKVKNPTHVPCTFDLSHLEPPFKKYHQTVVVKPKYYLSIPISFRPSRSGKFRSLFTLTHVESGKLLTATLIGETN